MVQRFVDNCRLSASDQERGKLSVEEIVQTEIQIIQQVQKDAFSTENVALMKGPSLSVNGKLHSLNPKLDENGLIRSDGRLVYAEFLSYDV